MQSINAQHHHHTHTHGIICGINDNPPLSLYGQEMGLGGGRLNKTSSFPSIVLVIVLLQNCYRYNFSLGESYAPTDKTQPN